MPLFNWKAAVGKVREMFKDLTQSFWFSFWSKPERLRADAISRERIALGAVPGTGWHC